MTNTEDLRYSRYERFVFWLTGRWPQAVVERRLTALAADDTDRATREDRAGRAA